jgi:hypothetical protein
MKETATLEIDNPNPVIDFEIDQPEHEFTAEVDVLLNWVEHDHATNGGGYYELIRYKVTNGATWVTDAMVELAVEDAHQEGKLDNQ